jgi:dihydrofolate reductase
MLDGKIVEIVAEVHAFVNDLARSACTYLYGRRMYETMLGWETDPGFAAHSDVEADFARIWQAADKVVYSTTLSPAVPTRRTRVERVFDVDTVRQMKASAERDLMIGGAAIASEAFKAELVDEYQLFLAPIVVGGGKPALPDGVRLGLELLDERPFANGTVHLRYRVTR